MLGKHHGKNAVIVLSLLSAGFLAAYIRYRPYIGDESTYTDGDRRYESAAGDRIRYAVWDAPRPLDSAVNTMGEETGPAISPDGRHLVFSAGRRGLNADLYVADLLDGVPVDPRPLSLLNSDFDEVSPAFSDDALFFASNRPGSRGGLDVFVASYGNGLFGEPRPFGRAVNSAADECDPAPIPGSGAIVFASNRPRGARRDFDLYLAAPGGDEAERVRPLDEIGTPFDEREPAVTADGRTLVFASDRNGPAGRFDLFRSVLDRGEWLPAEAIPGLDSKDLSERSPRPSRDGFSMLLSIGGGGAGESEGEPAADIYRARSLELFRIPGRPVGWLEILVLLTLLALALLAFLAKRWDKLEVIYRCLLVSLLVHLALLLWFRKVAVEPTEVTLPERSPAFRVRIAPGSTAPRPSTRERGSDVSLPEPTTRSERAVERVAAESSEPTPLAAAARSVEKASPSPERAPDRGSAEVRPAAARGEAEVALADAAAAIEKIRGEAPALKMQPLAVAAGPVPEAAAAAEPRRDARSAEAASAAAARGRVAPSAARALDRAGSSEAPALVPAAAGVSPERLEGRSLPSSLVLDAPRETIVARETGAPEMRIAAREVKVDQDPRRGAGSPARLDPSREDAADARGEAIPEPSPGRLEAVAERSREPAPAGGSVARDVAPERRETRIDVAAPVRDGSAAAAEAGGVPPASDDSFLPESPSATFSRAPRIDASPPARRSFAVDASGPVEKTAVPPPARDVTALPRAGADAARESLAAAPARSAAQDLPPPHREIPDATVARTPSDAKAADPEPAPGDSAAGDALALHLLDPKRFETERTGRPSEAPERWRGALAAAAPAPAGPSFRPIPAAPPGVALDAAPSPVRSPFDATPYRTRFGPEKERALELHGGGVETEKAVAAGLAYLARMQNSHGYWGSEDDFDQKYGHASIGKSGLCLLAFLGAGHTPRSGTQYSEVAERSLRFFLAVQDEKTGHFGYSEAYSHGIATYALAECYAMTKDERLRAPLERALAEILANQIDDDAGDGRRSGGWSYYYPDGRTFDRWPRASITAWQVMALESARLGGLEVPDSAFDGARRFLLGSLDPQHGYFRYSHDPSRLNSSYRTLPGSTPASLFALSLLGESLDAPRFSRALDFVSERAPRGYRFTSESDFVQRATGNIYFWYYATLALFRHEGRRWDRWNEAMKATLLPSQEPDGSWRPIEVYADYAGDSDRNRSYTTAMCVLTLEIYYRYFTPLLTVKPK